MVAVLVAQANVDVRRSAPGDPQDNQYGGTPLIIACRQFRADYVRVLIAAGVSVNQVWADAWTPLSTLCFQYREAEEAQGASPTVEMLECMRALLEAGAEYTRFVLPSWGLPGTRVDCSQILGLGIVSGGDAAVVAAAGASSMHESL